MSQFKAYGQDCSISLRRGDRLMYVLRLKGFNFGYLFYFRLALYVYEYLLHVGAQKAAQTFLSEVSVHFIFNNKNVDINFIKYVS